MRVAIIGSLCSPLRASLQHHLEGQRNFKDPGEVSVDYSGVPGTLPLFDMSQPEPQVAHSEVEIGLSLPPAVPIVCVG